MRKLCLSLAGCLIVISLLASNIDVFTTGPSGQGDMVYKAKSTGTTNLAMGASGLYNVTLNPAYAIIFGDLTINNATVRTNVTIGGTLGVTGVATFTATPVCKDGLTVGTNVTLTALTASKPVFTDANKVLVSTGTLAVDQGGSGAATLTDHGVLIGSGTAAITPLGVGTDGQMLIGASSADPAWATVGGAFTMAAGGTSTLIGNIDVARVTNLLAGASYSISAARLTAGSGVSAINGGSITNIPTSGLVLNANSKSLLDAADYSAMRTALTLRPGTDVQAYDADLDALALNNGGALTNLNGSVVASGTVPAARLGTNLEKVSGNDAGSLTNLQGSAFGTTMTAANLTAGTVASAIDGSAITNLTGTASANGTVLNALDISACTNLPASGLSDADLVKLARNDGGSLTNMAAATAFPGYAVCVVTNLDANGTTNIITFIGTVSYP